MAKTAADVWKDCLVDIKGKLSETQYTNFFEPIAFENFDKKTRTLLLQVPTRQLAEYLEGSFLALMSEVLASRFGQIRLQYHVQVEEKKKKTAINMGGKSSEGDITIATNLNPHYTFNTFIEGDANKLARSVGFAIAEHPRKTNFNPLFVYGPSGCGKTHLLNAIGNRTCELYPKRKVIYVDAREFQFQYTSARLSNKINDFLESYFQFDMMIVDDVQEWEGKQGTSDTFFHIFNHLYMSNKHIVLAADRTPAQLKNLDERMLSRFQCGIMTELGKPNTKLCYDILQAKIRRDGLVIPRDVVEYIARHASGSVRDLEGVLNSLLAYSIFIDSEIDMELVRSVVGRVQREHPRKMDTEQVIGGVCEYFGITKDELTGKSHKHELVKARQVAMYFLYHLSKMSINQIGRCMGDRNHATVSYGIERVAQAVQNNKEVAEEVKTIEQKLIARQ